MNRFFVLTFSLLSISFVTNAATKKDIAKDIAYLGQNIANDYLYLYNDKSDKIAKKRAKNHISKMQKDLISLAKSVSDHDSKNMLEFLSYSKNEMRDILDDDVTKEHALQMIDYGNTIYEGIQSIAQYDNFPKLDLLNLSTLYMEIHLDLSNDKNSKESLKKKVEYLDQNLSSNRKWENYKKLLEKDELFLPNINFILKNSLEAEL